MSFVPKALLWVAVSVLAGCANLQSVKLASVPSAVRGKPIEVSARPAPKDGVAPRAQALGDSGLYLVQTGGGSLALGVLFGGLGAAINSANVAAETDKLVKSAAPTSLLQLRPVEELNAAWRDVGLQPGSSASAVSTSPYLLLYVDDARQNVYPVAGLRVDAQTGSNVQQSSWNGHYLFAIDKLLSADSLTKTLADEHLNEFKAKLRAAYVQLRAELVADLAGRPTSAPPRQIANVESPYLKAVQIGFAGFTAGDVDISPSGAMSVRVSIENYGPAMDRSVPYFVWYFPTRSQYSFGLGPEPRKLVN